jgi:hypothetical protein
MPFSGEHYGNVFAKVDKKQDMESWVNCIDCGHMVFGAVPKWLDDEA